MRKVKITVDDSGAAFASTVNPPCDGCKGLPTDAVIYCIDCGKKMCEDHLEVRYVLRWLEIKSNNTAWSDLDSLL